MHPAHDAAALKLHIAPASVGDEFPPGDGALFSGNCLGNNPGLLAGAAVHIRFLGKGVAFFCRIIGFGILGCFHGIGEG